MKPYDPIFAANPGTGLQYPPSYWAATAGPIPADDGHVPARIDTEVAIIGGGYTGLSCAYHLAREHGVKPVLLEANRPGWGCSGRNGGFARMALGRFTGGEMIEAWGRDVAKRAFGEMMNSLDTVRALIRDGNIDCDSSEAGHLKIAHRPGRASELQREVELLRREFEYPVEYLSAANVQAHHIGGTESHGAMRIPDAVAVHPLKLSLGLLRMARDAGATVHSSSPVVELSKRGAEHVLKTPHGEVRAKTVVIATNGYTPRELHPALRATLFPVLSHIIVTRPLTPDEIRAANFITRHVLTDSRKLLYYWRRLPDDRIMFGGRGLVTDDPAGSTRMRDYLLSELKKKLPGLANVTVDYDWYGWVCLTRDWMPHVHHAEDDPSVHYAVGYQGSGVSMSNYAGKLLARRVAGDGADAAIPPFATPLPRFPLHSLLRVVQPVMYRYYKWLDERD
ncbi:MAG TPA: FAD-binding oxidoreductase [Burkholderiales bacterium]|nr:FAD-binding oxidoreductase [Burkholderiales bacterium]